MRPRIYDTHATFVPRPENEKITLRRETPRARVKKITTISSTFNIFIKLEIARFFIFFFSFFSFFFYYDKFSSGLFLSENGGSATSIRIAGAPRARARAQQPVRTGNKKSFSVALVIRRVNERN